MLIENSFPVAAQPDRVFEFLQDAHNVAACFPGAQLVEEVSEDTYLGTVKIKVGPVTATYSGTATIVSRDSATRTAVLRAEGKDSRGAGSANATARMHVEPFEDGATVQFATDLAVSGKLAQFGRGIMSDVSARMVAQLADAVRDRIMATPTEPTAAEPAAAPAAAAPGTAATAPAVAVPPAAAPVAPLRASSLIGAVIAGFFRRLFGRLRSTP